MENPFHLRSKSLGRRMKDGLLVPAEVLFEGVRGGNESLAVQRALGEWLTPGDELFFAALDRANAIRNSILQAEVVAYEVDADAGDDNVIEIFARLNQQGVRLRPGDLAAARLTGQMSNFRTRAREVVTLREFRGFSVPEGQEEGSRSGALRRHRSADPRGAVPGRRRGALPGRREEARSRPTTRTSRPAGARRSTGSRRRWSCTARHGIPSGDWLPYRYLLFPPAIAAARGIALDERWLGWAMVASLWRHYVGEVDTKLQKDAGLAEKGDVAGADRTRQDQGQADRERDPRRGGPDPQHRQRGRAAAGAAGLLRQGGRPVVPRRQADRRGRGAAGGARHLPARGAGPLPRARQRVRARPAGQPDPADPLRQRGDLGDTPASEYLPQLAPKDRSAHLIPDDPGLWSVENYKAFCEQRERALASMLHALLAGLGVG